MARRGTIGMRILAGAAGLVVVAIGVGQVMRGVHEIRGDSGPVSTVLSDLTAANTRLAGALTAAQTNHAAPPTLADPGTAVVVRSAFNASALATATGGGLDTYLALCGKSLANLQSYINFGASAAGGQDGANLQQTNLHRYDPEITQAMVFNLDCASRELGPLSASIRSLTAAERADATRRHGAAQVRQGMAGMIAGAITTQNDPISPASRQTLLSASVRDADTIAGSLDPAHRREVIAAVDQVMANPNTDVAAHDQLQRIRTAMSRTDCTDVCSF